MGPQLGQALRIQAEVVASAAPFFFYQPGGLQDLEVLRYRGPADGKAAGQLAHRGGAAPEQVDDVLAGRIGERAEHFALVSHALR